MAVLSGQVWQQMCGQVTMCDADQQPYNLDSPLAWNGLVTGNW